MIHILHRHRPIDTLLAACGTTVASEDMTPFISRMRELNFSAPGAADAAAAAARKSLDFPILLSFVITILMAFLFQSIIMRSSNVMSIAAAVVYSAAPARLIYPHRWVKIIVITIGIIKKLSSRSQHNVYRRCPYFFFTILFFSIIIITTTATMFFSLPIPFNLLFSFKVWANGFFISTGFCQRNS
jgi:hypothetical protein